MYINVKVNSRNGARGKNKKNMQKLALKMRIAIVITHYCAKLVLS